MADKTKNNVSGMDILNRHITCVLREKLTAIVNADIEEFITKEKQKMKILTKQYIDDIKIDIDNTYVENEEIAVININVKFQNS